jgi:hypothetical protein
MEIALSAEILGCGWFGERKNSQMLAVTALFLAVMKCKVMRESPIIKAKSPISLRRPYHIGAYLSI